MILLYKYKHPMVTFKSTQSVCWNRYVATIPIAT